MKTEIEMALEAGFHSPVRADGYMGLAYDLREGRETGGSLERFAELVRADEREKYKWDVHSCGPTCKRYACVAIREAVEAGRNATLDEIATKIEAIPFGDTAASFAVWIREQKT